MYPIKSRECRVETKVSEIEYFVVKVELITEPISAAASTVTFGASLLTRVYSPEKVEAFVSSVPPALAKWSRRLFKTGEPYPAGLEACSTSETKTFVDNIKQ